MSLKRKQNKRIIELVTELEDHGIYQRKELAEQFESNADDRDVDYYTANPSEWLADFEDEQRELTQHWAAPLVAEEPKHVNSWHFVFSFFRR